MIQAMIFDLDGTLVQTERLKAISYARAAIELCPYDITEQQVIEGFKDVVGLSRREVAMTLVEKFNLTQKAQEKMREFGVSAPWQAFVQIRLRIYESMLSNPQIIRDNQWAHNMQLLNHARDRGCKTALATMSHCEQATRILRILNLEQDFDFVATRDDVTNGKPDPEIYALVADQLSIKPENSLVIEDSPSGVRAATAAGMRVIAVSTPFTREGLRQLKEPGLLAIIDEPDRVIPQTLEILSKLAS